MCMQRDNTCCHHLITPHTDACCPTYMLRAHLQKGFMYSLGSEFADEDDEEVTQKAGPKQLPRTAKGLFSMTYGHGHFLFHLDRSFLRVCVVCRVLCCKGAGILLSCGQVFLCMCDKWDKWCIFCAGKFLFSLRYYRRMFTACVCV